jgi:hypothetical protein
MSMSSTARKSPKRLLTPLSLSLLNYSSAA